MDFDIAVAVVVGGKSEAIGRDSVNQGCLYGGIDPSK